MFRIIRELNTINTIKINVLKKHDEQMYCLNFISILEQYKARASRAPFILYIINITIYTFNYQ